VRTFQPAPMAWLLLLSFISESAALTTENGQSQRHPVTWSQQSNTYRQLQDLRRGSRPCYSIGRERDWWEYYCACRRPPSFEAHASSIMHSWLQEVIKPFALQVTTIPTKKLLLIASQGHVLEVLRGNRFLSPHLMLIAPDHFSNGSGRNSPKHRNKAIPLSAKAMGKGHLH